jgi:hypothetical protein
LGIPSFLQIGRQWLGAIETNGLTEVVQVDIRAGVDTGDL